MVNINKPPKLLDLVRDAMRRKHYSYKTEKSYTNWIIRYIKFHGKKHPNTLGSEHVSQFLTSLAVQGKVSASTQNQALNAIIFLYKQVLGIKLSEVNALRARTSTHIPVVLSANEVTMVLSSMKGIPWLMASLLYGTGMRLAELLRIRVKDIDFANYRIIVREGKGNKDRVVPFPQQLREVLNRHLLKVKTLHETDLKLGYGSVYLPHALDRKYPCADREWKWQYVFPSKDITSDPRTGIKRRHHIYESTLQTHVKKAFEVAGLDKRATCHSFRHCFATHMLQNDYDIRTVQDLLGHKNIKTTMIYTHVAQRGAHGTKSPFDDLRMMDNYSQTKSSPVDGEQPAPAVSKVEIMSGKKFSLRSFFNFYKRYDFKLAFFRS